MTTLTSNDVSYANTSTTHADEQLLLCVTQPGVDDRIIELPPGKSTVGSSERCQVRVEDPAARPLHCLIVREGANISVTRWAAGVVLNGSDFATSSFHPGDCLQIGQVEMSLAIDQTNNSEPVAQAIESAPSTNATASIQLPATEPAQPFSRADVPCDAFAPSPLVRQSAVATIKSPQAPSYAVSADEGEELVARLTAARTGARARCRKLVTVLRAMRTEASSFDQRVDDLQRQLNAAMEERQQILTQLSEVQAKAGERENQSTQEIDRLIAELTNAYEKASEAEASLNEVEKNAQNQRGELEQQIAAERELAVASAAALTELENQSQEIQTELAELRGQRDQWEQLRTSGELQRSKLAQAVADRERSIETLQEELDQIRHAADQADESRMEQAAVVSDLQAELEVARAERDQLATDQSAAQQYQAELEQSLADSEQNLAVFQLELEKFQITSRQTDQELTEKAAIVEGMQAEFTQIKQERDLLATKRTEYQLREQGWEHEIASRDERIEELTNEISSLRNSVEEAVQGVAAQTAEQEQAKQQLDAITAERDQLLATQNEQTQSIQAWEGSVATRDRRIAELEQEHDGICQVLQSVEKGAFEQVDTCNKLQEQLASLREERDQFANALPEQREYIHQLEQALAERDGQITLLSDELTKTTERQTALELQLADGTSAYHTLEAEMKELNAHCEQLLATQDSSDQDKAATEQTLKQYQQQIETLTQQIETNQQHRNELEKVVADGSQSAETYQSELTELRGRYEQLELDHQAERERRQQLDTELAERNQNLELFQVDLQSVRAELDRTVEQVASMETERETLNQQLTGLREELASQENRSNSSGADEGQRRDDLESELASARSQLEQLQQQQAEASDVQSLVEQLQAENLQLQELAAEHEQRAKQLEVQLEAASIDSTANANESNDGSEAETQDHFEVETQPAESSDNAYYDLPATEETESPQLTNQVDHADFHDDYTDDQAYDVADEYSYESPSTTDSTSVEVNEQDDVSWDIPTDLTSDTAATAYDDSSSDATFASPDVEAELVAEPNSEPDLVLDAEPAMSSDVALDTQEPIAPEALADEPSAEEPAPEEPVEEFKPTSFIDQYQHLLEDVDDTAIEPLQPVTPSPAPPENRLAAEIDAMSNPDDESDEALQAYMQNMLRRMRGDSEDDNTPAPQADDAVQLNQNPNPVSAVTDVLQNVAPQPEPEEPQNVEPIDMESLKRSSQKPALPTDLSAMRELANSSARKAIAKHHKRRHLEKASGLFLVCLVAICVGAYMLLTAVSAQDFLGLNFIGGLIAASIGLVGALKLLKLLLLAIREGSWEKTAANKATAAKLPQTDGLVKSK